MTKLSPEIRDAIAKLRTEGMSVRAIAEQTSISKSTVASALKSSPPAAQQQQSTPQTPSNTPPADPPAEQVSIPEEPSVSDQELANFGQEIQAAAAAAEHAKLVESAPKAAKGKKAAKDLIESLFDEAKPAKRTRAASPAPIRAPRASATPAEPSDPVEAGKYLASITLLVNNYPKPLADIVGSDQTKFIQSLQKKSASDLATLHSQMKRIVNVVNTANLMYNVAMTGASGVENITQRFLRMKTYGYTRNLADNEEELRLILYELADKRADSIGMVQSPEARLAMMFATTLLLTDMTNRTRESLNPRPNPQAKPANVPPTIPETPEPAESS